MSSPNINNIVIVGCVLAYISVPLYGISADNEQQETLTSVCHVSNNFNTIHNINMEIM